MRSLPGQLVIGRKRHEQCGARAHEICCSGHVSPFMWQLMWAQQQATSLMLYCRMTRDSIRPSET
eukprot:3941253-Amphidinium_carterae.1